jgi:DNA-binding IclR family transcriptional regulator
MDKASSTAGAQSLRRSLQLLRLLAQHQEEGLKLMEVIDKSGLERSTVHRLLSCLVEERFSERDPETRRYRLGIDAMQLGFASMHRVPLVDSCRPLLQKLARMSGDSVSGRAPRRLLCLPAPRGRSLPRQGIHHGRGRSAPARC